MNESENIKSSLPSSEPAIEHQNLRIQMDDLLKLFSATLIILLIISASLNLFLLRQMMTVRKDVMALEQNVASYQKNNLPQVQNFIASLQNYAKTHPAFVPVLAKYGLAASGGQTTPPAIGK